MPYIEADAQGPSRTVVQAFWQSTGIHPSSATWRVLPDACVDYLFDLADPTRPTRHCAAIIGTMTRAIVVPASGRRDLFGIRFRPGAVSLLWPLPMRELRDKRALLDDIVPGGSRLADLLSSTSHFRERIAIAEAWVEERFASVDVDRTELETLAAVNARLKAGASLSTLIDATGWNERRLQRFFETTYGTTAATMRCFWRFESVRRTLMQGTGRSLSAIALQHGYADQAHMTREFRRFSGLSISAWRAEQIAA
jgi:AraC-like DNA-binding protein